MLPRHPCPVCAHRTSEECERVARSAPVQVTCEHCLHGCLSLSSRGRPGPWLMGSDRPKDDSTPDDLELDVPVDADEDEGPD